MYVCMYACMYVPSHKTTTYTILFLNIDDFKTITLCMYLCMNSMYVQYVCMCVLT